MGGCPARGLRLPGVLLLSFLVSACGNSPATVEDLPAGQVVFEVGSAGDGWAAAAAQAARSPELRIYGDGRVLFTEPRPASLMAPSEYLVGQADPAEIARFAAELEQRRLVDLGTRVGSPTVTDQATTTTIALHGREEPDEIRIYAFATRFEDGLPAAAVENRQALRGDSRGPITRRRRIPTVCARHSGRLRTAGGRTVRHCGAVRLSPAMARPRPAKFSPAG
ncbi:hypothetical protein [Rhodococcus chondri]|uniref:Lipoprotein n=1 Tax=Rhodococcus chondri TaxID=3065941 RepID=A0ABU7JW08_9NOCA|nr:hypothetical protein [Rhodococcus sp. CC-R104]MEE2034218.1 hypothetical protein [Rhodococcus sp. CC-R104]